MQIGKINEDFKLLSTPELVERKVNGTEKGILPQADLEFYGREYERLVVELEQAMEKSNLPEKPTGKDDLNDLLIRFRLDSF